MGITKADVMRVYNLYIKNKFSVTLSCLPKGIGDLRAQPDNWKMYDRKIETESIEYKNLSYVEPKDDFNRSIMPKARTAIAVAVPNFYTTKINSIIPEIVHIDVQGAEFKVFQDLKKEFRPLIIWTEVSEFHLYQTGNTYEDFRNLMISLSYREQFKDNWDALYVLNNIFVTEYKINV
jgi:hypothetical protein